MSGKRLGTGSVRSRGGRGGRQPPVCGRRQNQPAFDPTIFSMETNATMAPPGPLAHVAQAPSTSRSNDQAPTSRGNQVVPIQYNANTATLTSHAQDQDPEEDSQLLDTPDIADPLTTNALITRDKRIAMRKSIADGEHIPRISRARFAQDDDGNDEVQVYVPKTKQEMTELLSKLDRAVRWNHLLTHSAINTHELIDSVSNGTVDSDSYDFSKMRTKVMDNTRTFKNKTLKNFETMIDQLIQKEHRLLDGTVKYFQSRFDDTFNAQNYFFCFYYLKAFVDFEGSCDRGKWFMRSIHINLGIAVWRWIKADKSKDAREKLLESYDAWALNAIHDEIAIDDFTQLTQKFRNQYERKKRDFSEVNRQFISVGPMPPKSAPRQATDHRSQPLDPFDYDGEENDAEAHDQDEDRPARRRSMSSGNSAGSPRGSGFDEAFDRHYFYDVDMPDTPTPIPRRNDRNGIIDFSFGSDPTLY